MLGEEEEAEERARYSPCPPPTRPWGSTLTTRLPTLAALKLLEPDSAARGSCTPRPSGWLRGSWGVTTGPQRPLKCRGVATGSGR